MRMARRQAASRRASPSWVPSRMLPKHARKPCWGCGREVEKSCDDLSGGLARFRRPENEPLGRPCSIVLVRLGHVCGPVLWRPLWGER